MSKRPKILPPTEEEDAAINRGIAEDPDVPELTDEDFKRMRPAQEVAPEIVKAYHEGRLKVRGRPKAPSHKVPISLRLSPEVVEFFRATGRGWQSRLNSALREYVKQHSQ